MLPKDEKIKLFRNKVNNDYSGGNMDGYEKSNGKYLLFINNDCQCMNDVIKPLVKFFESNSNVGLLTGKVRKLMEDILEHKYFHHYQKACLGQNLLEYS